MRFIYSDESRFPESSDYVATGMLISDSEVGVSLIQSALQELDADPDRHDPKLQAQDERTLHQGYFHASEDSKNAHSHLCKAINTGVNGIFASHYFRREAMRPHEQSDSHLLHLSSMLSSLRGFETRDEVKFIFERRGGLNTTRLRTWHEELELQVALAIYDQPCIPAFFPPCSFLVEGKENPGLQCTDFLLWVANRNKQGDPTWFNRIRSTVKISFDMQQTDREGGVDIPINNGITEIDVWYEIGDCPKDTDISKEKFTYIPFDALACLRRIGDLPDHLKHREIQINEVISNRLDPNYPDYIDKLAFIYIACFDTAPYINNTTTQEEKEWLLFIKKMMSLVLNKSEIHGVRTRDYLTRIWRHAIEQQSELLE